jgi:hypothetical protein
MSIFASVAFAGARVERMNFLWRGDEIDLTSPRQSLKP